MYLQTGVNSENSWSNMTLFSGIKLNEAKKNKNAQHTFSHFYL